MPSLNRVQLIGYLGRDAEARFTATGKKYAAFTLAVNRTWKAASGEKQEHTDWFMVNAWGKLGDFATEYIKKGRLVLVEGRLQTDRWEEKGETHYRTTVIARSIQLLDRRPEEPEEMEILVEETGD